MQIIEYLSSSGYYSPLVIRESVNLIPIFFLEHLKNKQL